MTDAENIQPLSWLWILRMLVPLKGHRHFLNNYQFNESDLPRALGLNKTKMHDSTELDQKATMAQLRRLHRDSEKDVHSQQPSIRLSRNLAAIAALASLTTADCRILSFVVSLHVERLLRDTSAHLGEMTTEQLMLVLAGIVGLSESDLRVSLSPRGQLAHSGLFKLEQSGCNGTCTVVT